MAERSVVLAADRFPGGSYHLRAHLREDGALVVEGQDLGATPEAFWGSREYEWTITVLPEAVPRLVAALDGREGEDPLELLAARYRDDKRVVSRDFLAEADVPLDFWSRVGD